jgi:hypothetical protein
MRIFDADVTGSLHVSGSSELKGNLVVSGSQTITGSLTVDGNTKFGDQLSDNHNFTGSVNISGSHTLTGSLNLLGNQFVSGSVYILNDLIVHGSSSVLYLTASQLAVSESYISVNVFEPLERFGGIKVYDSGSSNATASLTWDSEKNHWVYTNTVDSMYSGGMLISGPRNTGSLGDEVGTINNRVTKGQGGDHITSSNITDTGTIVSINSNSEITGSLIVTNGLSGSLGYSYLINVPTLVSGSSQISYSGLTGIPSNIISGSAQIYSLGFLTGYTDTNTFTTGATFNTGDGVITFTKNDGGTYTVDIDGRFQPAGSYLTGYTETDTFDNVTDRGSVTTNTIEVGGLTTNGDIQFGPVADNNVNYSIKSGGQINIHSNNQGTADQFFSNLVLKAGDGSTQSVFNIGGSNASTPNQGLWYTFGGSEYFRLSNNGTTRFNAYSTNGFVKFINSDGTLGVDTNTYLTSTSLNGYATTGYVQTQITNLIDSSPSTLDTLNELAAALGDDPNFATTVATSIGNKVSKSGDTMTGNLSIFKNNTTLTLGQINVSTGFTTIEMYAGDGGAFNGYLIRYNKDSSFDQLEFIDGGGVPRIFFENGGILNAATIKKIGGLSTQFLKADGSVDSNTYLTAHPSVSAAGSSNNSGRTYIQDILLDGFGHITGITTATETVTDTNDFISDVTFDGTNLTFTGSGGAFSSPVDISSVNTDTNYYVTGATFNTGNGIITLTRNDGGTVTVDIDGRFLTSYSETDTLATVTARGNTTNQAITVSGMTSYNDVVISGGTLTVYESVSGATVFAVDGTNGRLFAVTDDLSNSLFSVSTISGLPVIEAFADYHIVMGRFNQNDFYLGTTGEIGMGLLPVSGYKLAVSGNVRATSFVKSGGTSSQFLKADGSVDTNTYLTSYLNYYTTGVTFNTGDGVLTFTRTDGGTYTVDLDGRYGVSSTDYYTTGATFNTSNGVITYTRNDGGTYTVDIDGRFLTSYSEISTLEDVVQRGNTSTISITAASFITQGGNSGEFVKGDGSLDTNTYLTAHPSVSAASSSNNSGRTYIQDILLDSFGHITGITTASETVTDTNYYVTGATFNTGDGVITLTRNDGNTITVDIDGRFLTAHPSVSAASSSDNSGRTYIQDILLDSFGHITGITTGTETVVDTNTNYYVTGATFNTGNGIITLTRNDGNTVTVDIDGKYSELGHTHDDRYLPYVKNVETLGLPDGRWYTIAVNTGSRAVGKFILRDTSSGNHQSVVFYATHHYGNYSDITVLINSRYSGNPFRYIRIQDGSTYDGALLQVYIDQSSSTVQAWMLENIQSSGWVIKDWVDEAVDPGDVSNFPALTETPAQVDLDQTPQGGMIVTGPIYGGGDITQYEYLNTNNYSTTTDTRYYTETEIANFFGGSVAITGYNKSNWDTAYGWGNHASQGYATTGYVQTQITNLIDGAPSALDTLNELAAALGDDANFATTIASSIGAKLPLSGGTMTGNIAFGATSNLGLTWGVNTDAAFIKFISTSNAAGGSYLEIGTQDDSDEEIKFTQSGNVRFYLATDGFLRNGAGYKYVFENGTWGINISGNAATVTNGVYDNGTYSNPSWITALAGSKITGNITGNAYNITQYTINQDLGTSNSPTFSSVTATAYNTTYSPLRDKFRLWGTSSEYAIGMMNGMTYGGLNDYAMTFQFNSEDDRGFWWGDTAHSDAQGAMALTTNGYLTVARGVRVGYGESDTATPNVPLQVYGSGSLVFDVQGSQGQLFSITDSLSGSLFSVNDISGLPILEVFSDDKLVAGSFGTNAFVVSGTTTTVSGSFAVSGSATVNGGTVWHSGNDGASSGLDADTLDGLHASSFLTSYSETDTLASVTARGASTSTQSVFTGGLNARKNQTDNNYSTAALTTESYGNTTTGVAFHISGNVGKFLEMRTDGVLYWDNSKVWTAGTDGASSGLDADTLDGLHASSFLTAHPSVSAAGSSNNSGRTYIQDILLDGFGHITGITTASETVTDTNDFISDVTFDGTNLTFTGSGGAFSSPVDISSVNTDTNYYVTGATFNTSTGVITMTRNDGGTVTVDIDGKYAESSHTHSVIDDMTDEHRLFNNMGQNHSTYTDFNSVGDFGARYVNGSTNGPGTGSSQFYGFTLGLGNDYSFANYAMQLAIPRYNTSDRYVTFRTREATTWGSWYKIYAGYADTAGALSSMNISQFTNNSGYITGYSETDTLDSVLSRGASTTRTAEFYQTSNTFINTVAAANRGLTVYQDTAGADAYMTFHIGGDYAGYFGLGGAENDLVWGGWSVGHVRYRIWHSGNDGSGSGLDADTLDGQHASAFLTGHPSVSAAGSSDNSGRTYIQDILLDSFGHITGITTASETVVDTDTNYYVTGATFNTSTGVITMTRNDGGTVTVDIDGKYQEAGTYLGAISYNNNSNSNYQLLWGSGNAVYGTAEVYVNPSTDYVYAASFNASDWFRSSGNTGWYNSTHGGGIYQTESTMVRTYDNRGLWIDGGNSNTVQDATLYVTATNNNDWLAQFNAYNSSKSEYGIYVNIAAGATYGYALRTDSSSFTYRVDGSGRVYAPIYYDINDTAYYLNPASTSNLSTVKLNSTASGTEVFTVDGVNGRLFTITDDLSNSLFSVNTIAGVPVIEAFADNKVIMGRYNQNDFHLNTSGNIAMGASPVSGVKLFVNGNVSIGGANSGYTFYNNGTSYFNGSVYVDDNLTIAGGYALKGNYGSWTGEENKIQWHSNNLYFQNTGGGDFVFRNGGATNIVTITNAGALTATSLVKSGGSSSQFLMADGSVSTNPGWITSYVDTNNYTTGVTWNGSTAVLTFTRNNGDTYNVTMLESISDVTVTGGTYSAGTLTLTKSNGGTVTVTGFSVVTDTNTYVTGATFNTGNGVITMTRTDGGTVTVDIDGRYLESYSETDTLASVTTRGASTTNDITIGGLTVGGSLSRGTYTTESNYVTGADNIVLKGNSTGVSGIFFESERDGSNINHPSDFGFIQYHAFGIGGSSGESNRLVIGVSNDADDIIVLNPVNTNGLVVRIGAGLTEYTVYHSGNIPTWNQNTSGNAATATYATTAGSAPNASNLNASYGVTAGAGNGLKFWGGSDLYKIHMGNSAEYHYGPVTDYSIKTNIDSNGATRGFTWGTDGGTPIAALNVGNGNMQIAGTFTASNFSGSSSGTNTGDQTNISGNAATATYATTAGALTSMNISQFTNNSGYITSYVDTNYYVTGATFNTSTGVITLTRNDGGTVTVPNLDGRYQLLGTYLTAHPSVAAASSSDNSGRTYIQDILLDSFGHVIGLSTATETVTDNYITGATFNTSTGVITMTRNDGGTVTVDIDGRYLESYSETDTLASVTARGASTSTNLTFSGDNGFSGINTFSNSYNEFGDGHGSVSNDGGWNARVNIAGTAHARLDVVSVSDGIITSMYSHTGNGAGKMGTMSNHPLNLIVNGNVRTTLDASGNLGVTGTITGTDIYASNWFRNTQSNDGFYNEVTTQHLSSNSNGYWDMSSTTTYSGIRFYTGGHVSALRGYIYANTSNEIGFLNTGGNWSLRCDNSQNVHVTTAVYAPIYYDSNDTNYYLNPASTSNLKTVKVNSTVAGTEALTVDGVNGRLFTITDDMTDSIFSVNTISGLPVIEAFADYTVVMGRYGLNDFKIDNAGAVTIRGNTVWHAGNDGASSGLDADLLDGQHGSYYAAASSLSSYLPLGGGTMTGTITITNTDIRSNSTSNWTGDPGTQGKIQYHSARWYIVSDSASDRIVQFRRNGTDVSYIDNSGNFIGNASTATNVDYGGLTGTVPTWNQNTSGNAATATYATTAGALTSMNISQFTNNSGYITSYVDTNYYVTGATFNTSTGVITMTRNDGGTVTVDIDGKYAESSHTHDDRYFTETESDARFQPLENQRVSTSNSPTFVDIYANNWFRNNQVNEGLYNEATNNHWYSENNASWTVGSTNASYGEIRMRLGHQGTYKGSFYWDAAGIGILNEIGGWGVRVNYGGSYGGTIYGSWNTTGHFLPTTNNAYDLGSASLGWRNIYTNDLHLSNMNKPEGNDIDGTSGTWTIQEGDENLYIINNLNGKKYRITLEEI